MPTELIKLLDRIAEIYGTPDNFLENWAATLERESDILMALEDGYLITTADIAQKKAIAAILTQAAEQIDKVMEGDRTHD